MNFCKLIVMTFRFFHDQYIEAMTNEMKMTMKNYVFFVLNII